MSRYRGSVPTAAADFRFVSLQRHPAFNATELHYFSSRVKCNHVAFFAVGIPVTALRSHRSAHCRVDSLDAFSRIHSPESSLLIWDRLVLPAIGLELEIVGADAFPDVRARVHSGKVRDGLAALISAQGYDALSAFPGWLDDMTRLSEVFFDFAGHRPVTVRLETLARTGCPRFHVDHSYLRLVCTYRGPGTEWLDDAQVDRAAQASGAPNEAIVRFGHPRCMPTFAVGLMKGCGYPGCADAGLVHRSPTVEPGDPARVLFCLDC